jgi:hypothetical protein
MSLLDAPVVLIHETIVLLERCSSISNQSTILILEFMVEVAKTI